MGIQPHELIAVVGWQGLGKSTLARHFSYQAYLDNKTSLIFTLEMEASAMYRNYDSVAAGLNYTRLKSGTLTDEEISQWEKEADRAEKSDANILVVDDMGRLTVDKVYAEIVRHAPALAVIDYITLMEAPTKSEQTWERVTAITRELKQISRSLKVPIIAVAQTNIGSAQTGATLDTIAYSRSIGQDADIVFGLHQDDDMRDECRMEVRMLKNRDGAPGTVNMFWNPEDGEFRDWTLMDMMRSVRSKDGDETSGQTT